MKKYLLDMTVADICCMAGNYCLIKLTSTGPLPPMAPGQFVEVRVENSATTLLRRPISIHYVDTAARQLWLLIRPIGQGTRALARLNQGDTVNLLLPLGKGFTMPENKREALLLIGGGVGVAPLLYLGDRLLADGFEPAFLLGGRQAEDIPQLEIFQQKGPVYLTTEDGSLGQPGYVTHHPVLATRRFDRLYACGPKPMMEAVARYAKQKDKDIVCEVSLENTMACGLGACLCCVEKMNDGHHLCVCTEGPVFNINRLSWPI